MKQSSTAAVPDIKSLPLHIFRPVDHVRSFLKNGVRLDGRSLEQSRPISINYGVLQGNYVISSSHVQLGSTSVMCAISVMVGCPSVYKPTSGDTGEFTFPFRRFFLIMLIYPIGRMCREYESSLSW
jgi:hypothetical protein